MNSRLPALRHSARPPFTRRLGAWKGLIVCLTLLASACSAGPAQAADSCPNAKIREQQGSTSLPRCMAYELISPADASGGLSTAAGSSDGDHALIKTLAPIGSAQATGNLDTLAATRGGDGWHLRDLADPATPGNAEYLMQARAEDDSKTILVRCPDGFLLGCLGDVSYDSVAADGTRQRLLTVPTPNFLQAPTPVGVSADASLLFLKNHNDSGFAPLLPEDTQTGGPSLYVVGTDGLEYLGYDDQGNVLPCGEVLADVPSNPNVGNGFLQNGVSADGKTVFMESLGSDAGSCGDRIDIYMHRDGQTANVNISAPRDASPNLGALFAGNSRDGHTAYFTTRSQLVAADTDALNDVYAYDVSSDTVTRITPGANVIVDGQAAAVVSPNGDYVYFAGTRALGGQGVDGGDNLYVYHDGAVKLIASGAPIHLNDPFPVLRAPVTPDGKHLLFHSSAPLAGSPTGGTDQIFRYSVDDESLVCVSCPADGTPATASASLGLAPEPVVSVDQRFQSDDGSTVVYVTDQALSARDTNGVDDVYMWHEGAISLISAARDDDARLVSTTSDGRTVFFVTKNRLTSDADHDYSKLYAARVDGGFAVPARSSGCAEDACQGAPAASPNLPNAATVTFSGADGGQTTASSPKSKISVVGKVVKGARFSIAAKVTAAGVIEVSGPAVRPVKRTTRKGGTYRVRISLTRRAQRALRERHRVKIRVRVSFAPKRGASSKANVLLTVKG